MIHRSSQPLSPQPTSKGRRHDESRSESTDGYDRPGVYSEASNDADHSEDDESRNHFVGHGGGGSLLEEAIAAERKAALVAAQTAEAKARASLAAAHAAATAAQTALASAREKARRKRLEAFDMRPQCWSSSSSTRAADLNHTSTTLPHSLPLPPPPPPQPQPPISPPCAAIPDFDDLELSKSDNDSVDSDQGQLVEVWPLPCEHYSSAALKDPATLPTAEEEDFGVLAEAGDWFRAVSLWLQLTLPGAAVERVWRNERPQLFRRYAEARRAVASEVRARREANAREGKGGGVIGREDGSSEGSSDSGAPPMGGWFTGCVRDASGCNERWLWHGTSYTDPRIICAEGLDFRLSSAHSLWGRATYLAVKASYSDRNQYAHVCPPATTINNAGGRSGSSNSSSSSISTGAPRGLVGGLSGMNSALSLSGSNSGSGPSKGLSGAKELILCWAAIGRNEELGTTPKQVSAVLHKAAVTFVQYWCLLCHFVHACERNFVCVSFKSTSICFTPLNSNPSLLPFVSNRRLSLGRAKGLIRFQQWLASHLSSEYYQ